jgi:hypothetical protein
MSFASARARSNEQPAQENDPRQCAAYGCKCRATANVGGSGWACFAHAFAHPDQWQSITRALHDHDWLLGLVKDLRRMDHEHQNWREYATRFWEQSDRECVPHPKENATPYQDRMLRELLWRIGQISKRPRPRIPAEVKPAGRFAREVLKEAA